jgi:Antimicrobial peptide resistance and lipid A acylation protein PagP
VLRAVIVKTDVISYDLKKTFFISISVLLLSIFYTQTLYAGELHFVLNGKSIHIEKKPGQNLNERNYGAGFQYEFASTYKDWVPFINAGGFTDSYEKPSYYIGGGFVRRFRLPRQLMNLHFDAGVTGFVMTKADVNDNEPFPGMLPMISIGNRNAALNITYIPQLTDIGTDLWFMQLKFKLGRF